MSQFDMFAPPPRPARPALGPRQASAARRHEIFFALRPSAADAIRLAASAATEDGVHGQPLEPQRLHVSLYLMARYERGEAFPQADVERWIQAAATVSMDAFDVVFDSLATFGGETNPRVLRAGADARDGVAGLRRFQQALGIALANAGEDMRPRAFEPHMTMSYRGARIAEQATAPQRWTPFELVLIDSHVGEHLHEVLASWPFRA